MNYPCSLIQDLLPLYHDGVCSEESRAIVEQHLAACSACKDKYAALCQGEELPVPPADPASELKKAASLQAVKRKIRQKQLLAAGIALVLLAVVCLSAIGFLKNSRQVISPEGTVSVSTVDGSLLARLQGDRADHLQLKRVETTQGGQTRQWLFFCLSGSKWDALVTSNGVFSEYLLCPADKGADEIDAVYYYAGDYTGLESLPADQLQALAESAVLLWSR